MTSNGKLSRHLIDCVLFLGDTESIYYNILVCIYLAQGKSINHGIVQISWWQSSRKYLKKILKEKLCGGTACCAVRFSGLQKAYKKHNKWKMLMKWK